VIQEQEANNLREKAEVKLVDAVKRHTTAEGEKKDRGLLHGDLHRSFDIADLVVEGIDNLGILDLRDSIPNIAETFHVVPKTFILLVPNGL
jgi:hypothetical protein